MFLEKPPQEVLAAGWRDSDERSPRGTIARNRPAVIARDERRCCLGERARQLADDLSQQAGVVGEPLADAGTDFEGAGGDQQRAAVFDELGEQIGVGEE